MTIKDDITQNIGIIGSILTVVYIIPQIHKTHKTEDCSTVSCEALYLSLLASICWIIYGFMLELNAIMITHTIVFSLNLYRTHLYYKFNKKSKPIFPFKLFL
jgi:MtN3 and saliva related transmembrane protein